MKTAYEYLIVGGGVAADAAARGIREIDTSGSIGIISADIDEPYDRPPLSKYIWTDDSFDIGSLPLKTGEATGAEVRTGATVASIETAARTVRLGSGETVGFEKLLLATGAAPIELHGAPWGPKVLPYRSWADYRTLRANVEQGTRVAIVGGGFIASELAASLVHVGARVTIVTPDTRLHEKRVPPDLAEHITERYRAEGVELLVGARLEAVEAGQTGVHLTTTSGTSADVDLVVVAVGVAPAAELIKGSGIATDPDNHGVVVDAQLATTVPGVWAAGDLASYPDAVLGRRRVEHVDHAQHSGRTAGRNMAGAGEVYDYTPFFWSDLFDMGYEAIGVLDASLAVVSAWSKPLEEGTLYYLDDANVPVGVLTWNRYGRMKAARALLAARAPIDPADPPELPEDD